MSKKTYHKWYRRDHGYDPKVIRPRKLHPHAKLYGHVLVEAIRAKKKYNYGPKKMSLHLKNALGVSVSANAVYKMYKKRGLIRKSLKKQQWYRPMKEPYKASFQGENVQIDVKYVPGPDMTWAYQYRFMDTVTNMQYAVNLPFKSSRSTITAFRLAERYLSFPIIGVQTDNGGEFRGAFAEYLARKGVTHRFIPKRSAPWNGKVERANRSVDDEYYLNPGKPWKTLSAYVRWYNHERPHLGKGMDGMTPYQKLASLSLKMCNP